MYEELVKRMRQQHQDMDCGNCNTCVIPKAADAIEELSKEVMMLRMECCCCCEPPKEET